MSNVSSINNQKALVPKLRFPGFEGDYILTHIGDVFSERAERGGAAMELLSVTMNDGVVKRSQIEGKDNSSEDKSNYKIVRSGDLVYNSMRMWQGANGISKYDGIVSPAYTVLKAVEEIDEGYFAALFKTVKLINEFRKNSQGLTSDTWNLKYPQIAGIRICIPKIGEQHKISSFLQFLDKRIDAQRRFVENLKLYKRGVLSKLFPKKGTSVPECRFVGFTDDWEQRKLGEIADIVGGGTPSTSNDNYWDGDIDWYAPAEIAEQIYVSSSERKITQQGFDNSSAKMLPAGTVLFTSRAGIGKTAILRKKGCTNQGFQSIVPHENALDSYFIFSRSEELKRYGETVGAGSTFVEVSGKQMASMELMMPTTMEEQQQIGEFFSRLDTLITLHQRKLDELESAKKSLLQKMFI